MLEAIEVAECEENSDMSRLAELIGTLLLTFAVVGSGIMAQDLTRDVGLQLIINASATVASLYILINLIGPLSGAHFNPVVTMVAAIRGDLKVKDSFSYILSQFAGAILGTVIAHLLFERELLEVSVNIRNGSNLFLSEIVATFGLVTIAFAGWLNIETRQRASLIALWIGGAYFFTSSTSFANPAVTFGRVFTDSFSGIAPSSLVAFVGAQIIGGLLASLLLRKLNSGDEKFRRLGRE